MLNAVSKRPLDESERRVSGHSQVEEATNPGIVLSVLSTVERDSAITQRQLARELGIALGLANAYLRRCVRKGLVKMRQAPLNRYAYYLTPQGFAEKSRLTAEYLTVSLDFFRRARTDCAALLQECEAAGWRTAALFGAGELAEIAALSAGETAVEVVCVIDAEHPGPRCAGLAVVPDLAAALVAAAPQSLDGLVVTDTRQPQASFDALAATAEAHGIGRSRIACPSLLRISRAPVAVLGEATP
jgi:DNA-binding MarR family transcriptional regulator